MKCVRVIGGVVERIAHITLHFNRSIYKRCCTFWTTFSFTSFAFAKCMSVNCRHKPTLNRYKTSSHILMSQVYNLDDAFKMTLFVCKTACHLVWQVYTWALSTISLGSSRYIELLAKSTWSDGIGYVVRPNRRSHLNIMTLILSMQWKFFIARAKQKKATNWFMSFASRPKYTEQMHRKANTHARMGTCLIWNQLDYAKLFSLLRKSFSIFPTWNFAFAILVQISVLKLRKLANWSGWWKSSTTHTTLLPRTAASDLVLSRATSIFSNDIAFT